MVEFDDREVSSGGMVGVVEVGVHSRRRGRRR
jgi:hypothetical protein